MTKNNEQYLTMTLCYNSNDIMPIDNRVQNNCTICSIKCTITVATHCAQVLATQAVSGCITFYVITA